MVKLIKVKQFFRNDLPKDANFTRIFRWIEIPLEEAYVKMLDDNKLIVHCEILGTLRETSLFLEVFKLGSVKESQSGEYWLDDLDESEFCFCNPDGSAEQHPSKKLEKLIERKVQNESSRLSKEQQAAAHIVLRPCRYIQDGFGKPSGEGIHDGLG
jgi:hypothetical protein